MLAQAGFEGAELVGETGFDSSPVTKGALFRAVKPAHAGLGAHMDLMSKFRGFFEAAYGEGPLDGKTRHLVALGASLAAACES